MLQAGWEFTWLRLGLVVGNNSPGLMHFNMTLEKARKLSEQNQGTVCATLPRVSVLGTGLPRHMLSWCKAAQVLVFMLVFAAACTA